MVVFVPVLIRLLPSPMTSQLRVDAEDKRMRGSACGTLLVGGVNRECGPAMHRFHHE